MKRKGAFGAWYKVGQDRTEHACPMFGALQSGTSQNKLVQAWDTSVHALPPGTEWDKPYQTNLLFTPIVAHTSDSGRPHLAVVAIAIAPRRRPPPRYTFC